MNLESERTFIRLLNAGELVKYSEGKNPFTDISINFSKNEIDEELYPVIFNSMIPKVVKKKMDPVFNSLWLIIEKRFCSTIGSLSFKGQPDAEGKVEIGYGTHEEFQNRGYMTEAVGAVCSWVLGSGKAIAIIAETAKGNPASFGVLRKNGFRKFTENAEFYYWKLEKIG